ncbi:hypothetical protein Nepgr_019332 [Nepenthes gracilis]|uniref:Jasmonate O-methyltransferase n=1 Tax=Nepenthes gracilis TaxID=150966 RepID=A0AAD3XV77_NEPGR|nr:hypothetical protein Nepgr_019332 [Nepenthes gracilis]
MDVARVLHANGGAKEITYAKNSSAQKQVLSLTKPFVEEALHDYFGGTHIPDKMVIADLGCSSGPNALIPASEIIDTVHGQCQKLGRRSPEFMVFLNDLPGNDFNDIFTSLQPDFFSKRREDEQCRVAGVPGSFYGRLFLSRSLHFVHSSSSLHWLSQIPSGLDAKNGPMQNKGNIYITKTSTKTVMNTYKQQFKTDFNLFLKSRAEEMVSGGRMLLTFMGRMFDDPTTKEGFNHHMEMIAQSLMNMVSEGIIPEEKVDCFNLPCYVACTEEVKDIVENEGSFVMNRLESMQVDVVDCEGDNVLLSRGERVARMVRAMLESILGYHFGMELMDDLFTRYVDVVNSYLQTANYKFTVFVLSLTRQ